MYIHKYLKKKEYKVYYSLKYGYIFLLNNIILLLLYMILFFFSSRIVLLKYIYQ